MVNTIIFEVTIWENATSKLWPGEHRGQTRASSLDNLDLEIYFLSLLCYDLLDGVSEHGPRGGGNEATDIVIGAEPCFFCHGFLLGSLFSLE